MERTASFAFARTNSFPNRDLFGGDGGDDDNCPGTAGGTGGHGSASRADPAAVAAAAVSLNHRKLSAGVDVFFQTHLAAPGAGADAGAASTPHKDMGSDPFGPPGGLGGLLGAGATEGAGAGVRAGRCDGPTSLWPAPADEYERPKPDPTAFEEREWVSSDARSAGGGGAGGRGYNPPTPPTHLASSSSSSSPVYHMRQQPPEITRTRKIARSSSLTQTKVLLDMHPRSPSSFGGPTNVSSAAAAAAATAFTTATANTPSSSASTTAAAASSSSVAASSSSSLLGAGAAANARPPPLAGGAVAARGMELYRDFEILATIGCGNFSQVYKVRWRRNRKLYAVKKSLQPFRSRRDRDNYQQEVKAYYQLGPSCPQIIQYFCAWQQEGHFFVQMELCARGNLASFLKHLTHPVPEPTMWNWVRQIGLGLRHMHAKGLVHMDTKPENVFLTAEGTLKLGDLGMAREYGNSEHGLEGDNRYMAPELLRDYDKHPAMDIFSLGIMVLEITQQKELPQRGDAWKQLRTGQLPACPATYSQVLATFITCLMHPDGHQRPTADIILSHPRVLQAGTYVDDFIRTTPLKEDHSMAGLHRCDSAVMWQPDLHGNGASAAEQGLTDDDLDDLDLDASVGFQQLPSSSPAPPSGSGARRTQQHCGSPRQQQYHPGGGGTTTPRSVTPTQHVGQRQAASTPGSAAAVSYSTPRTVPNIAGGSTGRGRSRSALQRPAPDSAPTTPR